MPWKTLFKLMGSATLGAVLLAANVAFALPGPAPGHGPGGPPPGVGLAGPRPGLGAGGGPGFGRGGPPYGGVRSFPGRSAAYGYDHYGYGSYGYSHNGYGNYGYDRYGYGRYDRRYGGWRYPYGVYVYGDSDDSNGCYYVYSSRWRRRVLICGDD